MRRAVLSFCLPCWAAAPQLRWCGGAARQDPPPAEGPAAALLRLRVEELEVLLAAGEGKAAAAAAEAPARDALLEELHGRTLCARHTRGALYDALRERAQQHRERAASAQSRRTPGKAAARAALGSLEYCLGMLCHLSAGDRDGAAGEARGWFHAAAVQGHAGAMNAYGQLLRSAEQDDAGDAALSPEGSDGRLTGDSPTEISASSESDASERRPPPPGAAAWRRPPVYPKPAYDVPAAGPASTVESVPAFLSARAEARYWLEKAAVLGCGAAQFNLAMLMCEDAGGVATDDALHWLQKAAEEHSDADAMNQLGLFEGNDAASFEHFRKAAEAQRHGDAANNLAHCYEHGVGTVQNALLAEVWYTEAANAGNASAMHNLGHLYFAAAKHAAAPGGPALAGLAATVTGEARATHLRQAAFRCFVASASEGFTEAQAMAGYCHQQGIGTPCDISEAIRWWTEAGEGGHASAANNLGVCLLQGAGVARDPAAAVVWFRRGAAQGHAQSTAMLGSCLLRGEGAARDVAEGMKLLQKASDMGSPEAKRALMAMH